MLGITEGAEDALSAMQLTNVPCWASLGAGRMHRVAIPEHVRELHIFGDNDERWARRCRAYGHGTLIAPRRNPLPS